MKKTWWIIGLAGYGALILFGTLAVRGHSMLEWVYALVPPGRVQDALVYRLHNHHPVTFSRLLALSDYVVNLGLFLPVGVAFAQLVRPRVSWDIRGLLLGALAVGLLVSGSIELLQGYVPQRVSSLSDVVMNTGGMVFGCYLPYFLQACVRRKQPGSKSIAAGQ